jgi:uncharacterized membrane protein
MDRLSALRCPECMSSTIKGLTIITAIGAATAGGVFFAFSTFVMAGLKRLPASQGIAAMQSINVTAVRPLFMTLLFGTAALAAALGVRAVVHWDADQSPLLVAGALLYLSGAIVLTGTHHVPLNDSLAKLDPQSASAAQEWAHYLSSWTNWNHVRTIAPITSAACFTLALIR